MQSKWRKWLKILEISKCLQWENMKNLKSVGCIKKWWDNIKSKKVGTVQQEICT